MKSRILIVEPNYRSKFPPLGLLRISTFHKSLNDKVDFAIGCNESIKSKSYDKVYVSSLFTYELPKTVKTINYYQECVKNPQNDIIVGGIGATLLPEYIRQRSKCKIVIGALDRHNALGYNECPISELIPDYSILKEVEKKYNPGDAYFARVSVGCIRKCKFCAVPILEPKFRYLQSISDQINEVISQFGEKKDLVILDNNILALKNISDIILEISNLGFARNSRFENKLRNVDFNQGIDARLINQEIAQALSKICLYPVRLAVDNSSVIDKYKNAIKTLSDNGFSYYTTYVMFNFDDNPQDFYKRLKLNLELSLIHNIRITGFPMKFVPINQVERHHISNNWNWRYLRGIQCILVGTHGMVSPNPNYFEVAFGKNVNEFIEIISMPDDYIIFREKNKNKAKEWKSCFYKLNSSEKEDLFNHLSANHGKHSNYKHPNKNIEKVLRFYDPNNEINF